jgi:hypothetical protein
MCKARFSLREREAVKQLQTTSESAKVKKKVQRKGKFTKASMAAHQAGEQLEGSPPALKT